MGLDRRERSGDLVEGLLAAQEGGQARVWTAMPGIVQSFDPAKRTCVVQPAIQALVSNSDGTQEWATLPLLVDCPVQFPQGGGVVITFPIAAGDECLVVFASRCIDAWWQSGGVQVQAELRMHDLSDGFCLPGVRSVPNVEGGVSATEAEMRSVDGVTKVRLNPATHQVVTETTGAILTVKPNEITGAAANATLVLKQDEASIGTTGAQIKCTPNRSDITGTLYINGSRYLDHRHSNVTNGPNNSGVVVP